MSDRPDFLTSYFDAVVADIDSGMFGSKYRVSRDGTEYFVKCRSTDDPVSARRLRTEYRAIDGLPLVDALPDPAAFFESEDWVGMATTFVEGASADRRLYADRASYETILDELCLS